MSTTLHRCLCVLALPLGLALAGCPDSTRDGPLERAGEKIDDVGEDIGDKAEDVADDLDD